MTTTTLPEVGAVAEAVAVVDRYSEPAPLPAPALPDGPAAARDLLIIDYSGASPLALTATSCVLSPRYSCQTLTL